MTSSFITRRLAGMSIVSLVLLAAAGCTSSQDRARMEQAAQDNVALKAQLADMTAEHDTLKKDLASLTKERDQYKAQVETVKAGSEEQAKNWKNLTLQSSNALKATQDDLAKAKTELEAAKKSQADAEQTAIRLKAAEDGVTAARAKAADSDKAAATAAAAATQAKDQAAQLAAANVALQQKLDALTAELAKKPDAPKAPAPK